MDELLKTVMNGVEDDKSIAPKITKTVTEETTSFVRLENEEEPKNEKTKETKAATMTEKEKEQHRETIPPKTQEDEELDDRFHLRYEGYRDRDYPPHGNHSRYRPYYNPRYNGNPNWGNNYRSNFSNYGGRRPHYGDRRYGWDRGNY